MKIYSDIYKYKKIKLLKKSLGVGIIATSLVFGGCSAQNDYYLVTENGQSYICTRMDNYINYDDYDFKSITDSHIVGSICSKRNSFDYSKHHLSINFLNEMQVVPLDDVFKTLNIDNSILNHQDGMVEFASSDSLDKIRINYYVQLKYDLNKNFVYTSNSQLQLFVTDNDVIIGYDISPDRCFNKHKYIYSISDLDVRVFKKADYVQNISVGLYLTDEQKNNGYITYNEAIEMVNKYINNYYKKSLIKK